MKYSTALRKLFLDNTNISTNSFWTWPKATAGALVISDLSRYCVLYLICSSSPGISLVTITTNTLINGNCSIVFSMLNVPCADAIVILGSRPNVVSKYWINAP